MDEVDYFISYNHHDEWAASMTAEALHENGYRVAVQSRDFYAGDNFVSKIHDILSRTRRLIIILSRSYVKSEFATAEWMAIWAADPLSASQRIVPIRIDSVTPPGLLSPIAYIDILGLEAQSATECILIGIANVERRAKVIPPGGDSEILLRVDRRITVEAIQRLPLPRNRRFIGRDEAIAEVNRIRAEESEPAVVAVTGLGGIGKTQLALEYCYRNHSKFEMIWWIASETVDSAQSGLAALASELERTGRLYGTDGDGSRAALSWLERNSGWVIVFDNVERPEQVADLLPRFGRGLIIITSRWSEWVGLCDEVHLHPFSLEMTSSYLRSRTNDNNEDASLALAKELAGLPLAMEQASAFISQSGTLNIATYLAQFQARRDAMLDKGRILGYDKTLATVWDMSLDQLPSTNDTRRLLNLVCVMAPDEVPVREIFEATSTKVLQDQGLAGLEDPVSLAAATARLKEVSLAEFNADTMTVHRLVRHAVLGKLEAWEVRSYSHAALILLKELFPSDCYSSEQWQICERYLNHALEVVASIESAAAVSDFAAAASLLKRVSEYLGSRIDASNAVVHAERAASLAERAYGIGAPETADYHTTAAFYMAYVGRLAESVGLLQQALESAEPCAGSPDGDMRIIGVLRELSWISVDAGRPHEGRSYIARAAELASRHCDSDDPLMERIFDCHSWILAECGELTQAYQCAQYALAISEAQYGESDPRLAQNLDTLGAILIEMDELGLATHHLMRAQRIATEIYDARHPRLAEILWTMAKLYRKLGSISIAIDYAERAIEIVRERLPSHPDFVQCMATLGQLLMEDGKTIRGKQMLASAEDAARNILGTDHPRFTFVSNLRAQFN